MFWLKIFFGLHRHAGYIHSAEMLLLIVRKKQNHVDLLKNPSLKQLYGGFLRYGYRKMDGEKNGKPYFLMDDLGEQPTILGNPPYTQDLAHFFATVD